MIAVDFRELTRQEPPTGATLERSQLLETAAATRREVQAKLGEANPRYGDPGSGHWLG